MLKTQDTKSGKKILNGYIYTGNNKRMCRFRQEQRARARHLDTENVVNTNYKCKTFKFSRFKWQGRTIVASGRMDDIGHMVGIGGLIWMLKEMRIPLTHPAKKASCPHCNNLLVYPRLTITSIQTCFKDKIIHQSMLSLQYSKIILYKKK